MKKILILVIILSISIFFILINQQKNLNYQLKKYGIEITEARDFKITKNNDDNITANQEKKRMKIKIFRDFNKEKSERYIEEQMALLESLFEPQLPPYPEFLTKETGCNEKFKPIKKESQYGNYYLLYAGERFGYGICTEDLIKYKASIGFFYCSTKNILFKIEYFIPYNKNPDKLINLNESFKCLR